MKDDLVVTCQRCGNHLTHECNTDLRQAIIDLMVFTPHYGMPDFLVKASKKAGFYDDGDDDVPFVSETFLYPLLGKDDARTFMALINHVLRCAGVDPHSSDLDKAVNDVLEGRAERKRLAEQRQKEYLKRRKAREASKNSDEPELTAAQENLALALTVDKAAKADKKAKKKRK